MNDLAQRGPIGLKAEKAPPRRFMRRTAKGKKASSNCPVMRSAKDQPCLADWCGCGGSTDTTAMRHVRKFCIGGTAMKPPNFIGYYGCQLSEDLFENTAKPAWTWKGLMQAMMLTQNLLSQKGYVRICDPDDEALGEWL